MGLKNDLTFHVKDRLEGLGAEYGRLQMELEQPNLDHQRYLQIVERMAFLNGAILELDLIVGEFDIK